MKKLINDPRNVVPEMLEGIVLLSPELRMVAGDNVIIRGDIPSEPENRPVSVISGGGSGHEPAHARYVGRGMLSAAVAGDVFTSPSVDAALSAIRATSGPAGALLVVKNYTGDRLNFGLAAELARREGIPVEIVTVADDVALRDLVPKDRRRGIAGTILVHKVAGAAAAQSGSLQQVANLARRASESLGTMGVGLGTCTVPTAGRPSFELGDEEIEFGLGIHGEKGVLRAPMQAADQIVGSMLDIIVSELSLPQGSDVALMVNGLGATTAMELAIVTRHALSSLASRGLVVVRAWSGEFMTALEMPGCSLTILGLDAELTAFLDEPTEAAAWGGSGRLGAIEDVSIPTLTAAEAPAPSPRSEDALVSRMRRVTEAVAGALDEAETELAELDRKAGDGDLGASMRRGAAALRTLPESAFVSPEALLAAIAGSLRRAIAGSSGPFYAIGLLRAAEKLAGIPNPTEAQWRDGLAAGTDAIAEIGGAKRGDRTMLDALYPAIDAWTDASGSGWNNAVAAAEEGAGGTAAMHPRAGRASYLGERALGVPDGGAVAVAIWMRAVAAALEVSGTDGEQRR